LSHEEDKTLNFKNPALAPSTRQASLVASGPAAVRAAAERIFKIPKEKIPVEFSPLVKNSLEFSPPKVFS